MKITSGSVIVKGNGLRVSRLPSLIADGLTMYMRADTSYAGASLWYDSSDNGADVVLSNSPTWAAGPPAYFLFDGVNQYGTASHTNIVPSTAYTKTAWFYWTGYDANNNIVSGDPGGHFMFGSGFQKIYCGHSDWGSFNAFESVTTIALSTWYYAALTFNTTDGMALYINGQLDNTYTAVKTAHPGDGSVNIASYGAGNFMKGGIGEVHCYNRSLSAGEILQNFNTTRSKYGI